MPKLRSLLIITTACLLVVAGASNEAAGRRNGFLKVHVLDVGQGDAIFIESPTGTQILVDGGPDASVLTELSKVIPFYDRSIDAVIATHGDADHITGLIDVLSRYEVGTVIQTKAYGQTNLFKAWQVAVENEGSKVIEAIAGTDVEIGGGAKLQILFPTKSFDGQEVKQLNDTSVVTMIDYHDFEMLLTGDIEEKGERQIVLSNLEIDADVLKVGHHGSKTSTSQVFLDAVSPQLAVMSLGLNNRYGHPHSEVISRLEQSAISYYRTDTDGAIMIVSDGAVFNVKTLSQ